MMFTNSSIKLEMRVGTYVSINKNQLFQLIFTTKMLLSKFETIK